MIENMLEVLLDNVPYSIWLRSNDGKFVFANQYFCDSLNKSKEDILGSTVYDIYEKELGDEFTQNYKEVENLGKPKLFTGYQGEIFLECYIALIIQNRQITGYLGILQNQTERKKHETEIIKQKNLLKTLIDTIPDSIFYKDIDGTYLNCNKAFANDYYNKSEEEVIGKKDIDLVENKRELKKILDADSAVLKNNEKQISYVKIGKDSDVKYMECIKTPLIDEKIIHGE